MAEKTKFKVFGKTLVGWNDIMDMLSTNDKTSKAFQSNLNKITKVSDQETAEKKGNRVSLSKINEIAKEIFGLKNDRKIVKKFIQDSKVYLKIGKALALIVCLNQYLLLN